MNKRKSLQQFLLQGLFSFMKTHLKGGEKTMRPTRKQIILENLIAAAYGFITEEQAKANIKEELKFWGFQVADSDDINIENK